MRLWHIKTNTFPPKTYSLGKLNALNSVITKQERIKIKELKIQLKKLESGIHNKPQ